jgi:TldD protein
VSDALPPDGGLPLEPALLERLLAEALSRGGDYADLYFERREEAGLLMEEDVLRNATAGVVAGVGVRVLSGERTGFAYTEDLTPESMARAARTAAPPPPPAPTTRASCA